ncbi:MAG: serine hydroxymethyltransferase [Candidatus Thermoplasmatota archaeon]|nr:serine hydroxymethyltransferase [Candidatus Thermoplasmatota archaeon]
MKDVLSLARQQETWRLERCINLIPSENVTSPQVRELLASDFGHRYSLPVHDEIHGSFVENAYRGTRYLDEMESLGEELARDLFNASYASLKPLSGHVSGLIALISTCNPGDAILVVSPEDGGYDGYGPEYLPKILGLQVHYLPFDRERWNLRVEQARRMIEEVRPRLVILGASLFLFPYELSPLRRACDATGALLAYDASHVMGLIAGGEFQRPLEEGVDILLGSTHKSLFGPQGGLIAARGNLEEQLESMTWRALDNAHWNRIAALTQALMEAREFGKDYAGTVVKNARRLGRELDGMGFAVGFSQEGYTRSPQLLLEAEAIRERFGLSLNDLAIALEKNDIIVDSVGRIGTNEITRMGGQEEDMVEIAEVILRCAQGENVAEDVASIRQRFSLSYAFEDR